MTGRYTRSVFNRYDILHNALENHPLPEIIDGESPKVESLNLNDLPHKTVRIENEQTSKKNFHLSKTLNIHEITSFSDSNFSDGTRCTPSTDSWCDDEFEKESTKKVQEMLDTIDEMIYEGKVFEGLSEEIHNECQLWAEKFPYFRIVGKQIIQPKDDSIQFLSLLARHDDDLESSVAMPLSFHIKGTQLPILPAIEREKHLNDHSLMDNFDEDEENYDAKTPEFIEETIAQHGEYEEFLACHQSSNKIATQEHSTLQKTVFNDVNVDYIRERVLDRIMEKLWPEILTVWQMIKEEQINNHKEHAQKKVLPVLSSSISSPPQLGKPSHEYYTSCHPLDGILTVSSKMLQRRDQRFNLDLGIITRPGSSLISPCRVTSFSNVHVQETTSVKNLSQYTNANFPSVPNSRVSSAVHQLGKLFGKDTGCSNLLQEENDSLPYVVRSPIVHRQISEPIAERSESKFPTSHFSLPPISDNKTGFSHKQVIKFPLSPNSLIESPLEKFTNSPLYRAEMVDSRPSTCKSNRSLGEQKNKKKSPKPTQHHLDVPILGGLSAKLLSPYSNIGHHLPSLGQKTNTERLLTLYPIIKSVELQRQDDNRKSGTKSSHSARKRNALNRIKQ